ncbi:hypothetical protein [Cohnella mopanensis]|uniref:hypothetical protein n=1 Tax=Cohnella mopanensis TaxID=2911966 RepID=UPI001EF7CBD6|nr:hypothetical protein [Cohnella mopanensis]
MSDCPKCKGKAVFDPPQTVYEDYFHPQQVDVIHQIEVVRRHHCVPVYNHVTTVSVKDVYCGDFEEGHGGVRTSNMRKR